MSAHFIVAVEHGRLRLYTEGNTWAPFPPRVQLVETINLDDTAPLERTVDGRLRFPAAQLSRTGSARGAGTGHGTGRREELRRAARLIAVKLQAFWQEHPMVSWDLAAPPAVYEAIIEALPSEITRRLKRVYSNELIGQAHEAGAVSATAFTD